MLGGNELVKMSLGPCLKEYLLGLVLPSFSASWLPVCEQLCCHPLLSPGPQTVAPDSMAETSQPQVWKHPSF